MTDIRKLTAEIDALYAKATQGECTLEHTDTAIAGPMVRGDWEWVVWPVDGQDEDDYERMRHNTRFLFALRNAWPTIRSALQGEQGVMQKVRRLLNGDLYNLLLNIQNGISSPADEMMANSIIRRIDALDLSAPAAQAAKGVSGDAAAEAVMVPVDALRWLFGMGDSFSADGKRGAFWWRSEFMERAGLTHEQLATAPSGGHTAASTQKQNSPNAVATADQKEGES